jgi:hypothetical protein
VIPPQLPLDVDALVPRPEAFRTRSALHGQAHVARVMVHAFRLLRATALVDETVRLWGAVYLHDLERTHDGVCRVHGAAAWRRFTRDAALQQHLAAGGISPADWPAIETAVTRHSLPGELPRDHPHWTLTALLKDADALDRVRIDDLDPRYLRFPAAGDMVDFAWSLFLDTDARLDEGPTPLAEVVAVARRLDGR